VIGAGILTGIEEATRQLFGGSGRGTDLSLYGLIILAVAVYYPNGGRGGLKAWSQRRAARASRGGSTR